MGKLKWAVESTDPGSGELMLQQQTVAENNYAGDAGHVAVGRKDSGTQTMDMDVAAADEMMLAMLRAQKAEKLRRLRSGFEICTPHGLFLWPPTQMKSQLAPMPVADHFLAVPTPPAIPLSSGAAASPLSPPLQQQDQPQPGSPFKPMAEMRASSPVRENSAVGIDLND